MKFEILEINECQNKNCNQKFTLDNIKLAVWLHGVFFLSQENRPTGEDPLFPLYSSADKKIEKNVPIGYVGLTCPKCLETILYFASHQDLRDFKKQLQTMVSLTGSDPEDKSQKLKHDLRYYAPFDLEPCIQERFDMEEFFFDGPEYDPEYFQDEFLIHTTGEMPGLWEWYCAYLADRDTPAGSSTHIRWFKEEQLSDILNFEKSKGVRIFPRYHYMTPLVNKIDALQKYNHQSEIETARSQHKRQEKARYEKFLESDEAQGKFEPQPFDDFFKVRQSKITNVPQLSADFLEMLISGPETLKDISGRPTSQCNYLWARINPFHELEYPESFPAELESKSSEEDLLKHDKMVALLQENLNKQCVHDFLRKNLVNFLEKYEDFFWSREFSYAAVWRLKEDFFERLYKETSAQIKHETPYSMGLVGEVWIIKFGDQKARFYPNERGFLWIYNILKNPKEPIYYTWLDDNFGKKSQDDTVYGLEDLTEIDKETEKKLIDKKSIDNIIFGEQFTTTYSGVVSEQKYVDDATLSKLQTIVDMKIKVREECGSKGNLNGYQKHDDGLNALLKYLDRKIGVFAIECKPKEGFIKLQSRKFKDARYKKTATRIKKNYADAMTKIKDNDPALHQHFLDYIKKEGGAFIYKPAEDIVWHLD